MMSKAMALTDVLRPLLDQWALFPQASNSQRESVTDRYIQNCNLRLGHTPTATTLTGS